MRPVLKGLKGYNMFQNLRASSQLYILHKDNKPYVEVGSVVGVSAAKPKYPMTVPPIGQMPQMEMVVDITANVNGQNTTFQNIPAGAEIADFGTNGNIVISCSRDAMNSEIASLKKRSLDIINSVSYHQTVVTGCDEMLNMLNPEYAEKQRQDQEISDLKKQMAELMSMNKKLMQALGNSETTSSRSTKKE